MRRVATILGTPRRALVELLGAVVAWMAALLVLRFLHGDLRFGTAIVCGLVGPLAVRSLLRAGSGRDFPDFLMVLLDVGAMLAGVLVASWATLLRYPWPYWALRAERVAVLSLVALAAGSALVALVYTHRRMAEEVQAGETRLAAIRESALRARVSALQAQIHPHFLFNALNTLAELAHRDARATERLVTDLAWLLRYTLRTSAEAVPLGDEMEAVRRYLRIEQARYGDRLQVALSVPDELHAVLVPGLCLQPLVENAVKYSAKSGDARVTVEARRDGARLLLLVADEGPGLPDEVRGRLLAATTWEAVAPGGTGNAGGGLLNVQQRLALLYPGRASIVVEAAALGTRLRLELPA